MSKIVFDKNVLHRVLFSVDNAMYESYESLPRDIRRLVGDLCVQVFSGYSFYKESVSDVFSGDNVYPWAEKTFHNVIFSLNSDKVQVGSDLPFSDVSHYILPLIGFIRVDAARDYDFSVRNGVIHEHVLISHVVRDYIQNEIGD